MPRAAPVEWQIRDLLLYSGDYRIFASPQWQLRAWPNAWDLPLAFDANPATTWRTWETVRAGMYVEADFDRPQALSGVVVTSPIAFESLPFQVYERETDGWHLLASPPVVTERPFGDVRIAATQAVRSAGFRYILANNGYEGNGILGAAMVAHEADWGLERVADYGPLVLFRIK
jgi:hypothetical protein